MKFAEAYTAALDAPISEKFEQLTGTLAAIRSSRGLTHTEREKIRAALDHYTDLSMTVQTRYRKRQRSFGK